MSQGKNRPQLLLRELKEHLPFTLLGVVMSIVFLFLTHYLLEQQGAEHLGHDHDHDHEGHGYFSRFFHTFHFAHIFISTVASTAIFFRHQKSFFKAASIGILSSLIFCTLSDVLLPFLGGLLLRTPMDFHWDVIEEPLVVLSVCLGGAILGLLAEIRFGRISYFTHGSHVFISSLASLFYLVSYGIADWQPAVIPIFIITSIAVVIPCCTSDIFFPLSLVGGFHGHEHEDEHTQPPNQS